MAVESEDPPLIDADALEHAVGEVQPAVEDGYPRLVRGKDLAIDVNRRPAGRGGRLFVHEASPLKVKMTLPAASASATAEGPTTIVDSRSSISAGPAISRPDVRR